MTRKRTKQMQLAFPTQVVSRLPKEKKEQVVQALADLLLATVTRDDSDDRRQDDESQDHG